MGRRWPVCGAPMAARTESRKTTALPGAAGFQDLDVGSEREMGDRGAERGCDVRGDWVQ